MNKIKSNKTSANLARIIIFALIGVIILLYSLTNSIKSVAYDKDYYYQYSRDNNIKSIAMIDQEDLENRYSALIDYIKIGDANLINNYFNEKEVAHMEDVHELFNLNNSILSITLIISIAFYVYLLVNIKKSKYAIDKNDLVDRKKKNIDIVVTSILLILGLVAIVGFLVYKDFNSYFIKFHELFFDNDLWLLDPRTDIMIRMLPEDYFMKLAFRILFRFLTKVGLIIVILLAYKNIILRRKNVWI